MAAYIDKKAVLSELDRVYNLSDFPAEFYNGYQFAESIVRNFKKADVAEVRHGEWLETPSMAPEYRCSECEKAYEWWEPSEAHYCPYCGAKMDLGGADNG